MKKTKKVVLIVVAAIAVLLAGLAIWQWDNLTALYMGITMDESKIEERMAQNKQKLAEILKEENIYNEKVVEGFSKETEKKIAKGEISIKEAVDELFKKEEKTVAVEVTTPEESENPSSETTPSESNSSGKVPSEETSVTLVTEEQFSPKQQLLQSSIKEMYTLKATFTKTLAELERKGKKMYIADGRDGMTQEHKMQIADYLMPEFAKAEKECDQKVEVVLKNLKEKLEAMGEDSSVVDTIREQYNEEKQLKKAYYIKEYL